MKNKVNKNIKLKNTQRKGIKFPCVRNRKVIKWDFSSFPRSKKLQVFCKEMQVVWGKIRTHNICFREVRTMIVRPAMSSNRKLGDLINTHFMMIFINFAFQLLPSLINVTNL